MGSFRFRRTIGLIPGLRLNLSKTGVSASVGVRGAHVTLGGKGIRTTVGLPGTGLSYTEQSKWPRSIPPHTHPNPGPGAPADPAGNDNTSGLTEREFGAFATAITAFLPGYPASDAERQLAAGIIAHLVQSHSAEEMASAAMRLSHSQALVSVDDVQAAIDASMAYAVAPKQTSTFGHRAARAVLWALAILAALAILHYLASPAKADGLNCQRWQDIHYCSDNHGNAVYQRDGYVWTNRQPHTETDPSFDRDSPASPDFIPESGAR